MPDPSLCPPISILVPAYNEEAVIETTLAGLFQLDYPEFEIVVINDGSSDRTLQRLQEAFALYLIPNDRPKVLDHHPIRGVWRSKRIPNLLVIDKVNGRKADALNAGLTYAQYPLYCCIDADSYIRPDGLRRAIRPFIEDPLVVGVGGGLRVMNGARVNRDGLVSGGLSRHPLAAFQALEYLRAFTLARMGWTAWNASPLISGAFALYRKDLAMGAGGYRPGCIGDDSDMTLRMHQYLSLENRQPYRIVYLPEPICWTQAPADWQSLFNQRLRWQRGAIDSIWTRRNLLFNPACPGLGFASMPFILTFTILGPIIYTMGFLLVLAGVALGLVNVSVYLSIGFFIYTYWVFMSTSALLLDDMTFKSYPGSGDIFKLFLLALAQSFGYYQMTLLARITGIYRHLTKGQRVHGHIARHAMALPV